MAPHRKVATAFPQRVWPSRQGQQWHAEAVIDRSTMRAVASKHHGSRSAPASDEPPDELRFSSEASSAAADRMRLLFAPLEACCLCGYGRAGRFLGRGGGMSSCCPSFSNLRKNFCAWLRICARQKIRWHHSIATQSPRIAGVQGWEESCTGARLLDAAGADMVDDLLPVAAILVQSLQKTLVLLLAPRFPRLLVAVHCADFGGPAPGRPGRSSGR